MWISIHSLGIDGRVIDNEKLASFIGCAMPTACGFRRQRRLSGPPCRDDSAALDGLTLVLSRGGRHDELRIRSCVHRHKTPLFCRDNTGVTEHAGQIAVLPYRQTSATTVSASFASPPPAERGTFTGYLAFATNTGSVR